MQIANGTIILSPENHQFKLGLTPAETLILYKLHYAYSNGSPLGQIVIQPGEAETVESEGKPGEEAYFNQNSGRHVDAKPAIPAKTHKRTQAEEIARLKRKYTGNITVDGTARPAFEATFGNAIGLRLPETFEEIEEITGTKFLKADEAHEHTEDKLRTLELGKQSRADVAALAIGLKLKVHPSDSKEYIIAAIINAENKAALSAAGEKQPAE